MTVYNEWRLNLSYLPQNLTQEACYRYNILIRYTRLPSENPPPLSPYWRYIVRVRFGGLGVPYLIFILISTIAKNIKIFTTKIIEYIINPKHLCITLLGLSICKFSFLSSFRIVSIINNIIGIIKTNNIDIGINTYIIKIR